MTTFRHRFTLRQTVLCGFVTPSLTAQGGQRLLPYFNNRRGNPISSTRSLVEREQERIDAPPAAQ
jgi:hypothetical protein